MKIPESVITTHFPRLYILIGSALLTHSLMTGLQDALFNGYRLMALGVLLLGIGEVINHPLQTSRTLEEAEATEAQTTRHRRRNPSSIGNLLLIIAILLLCIGFSKTFLG